MRHRPAVCLALALGALLAGCAGSASIEPAQNFQPVAGQKFAYEISASADLRQDERLAVSEGLRRRLLSTAQLGAKGDASTQEVLVVVDTWVRTTTSTQFIEQMSTPAARMSSTVRVQGAAGAAIGSFRVTTEPGVTRGALGGAAQHGEDIGNYLAGRRR